jgi:hypothetical protein
MAELNFLTLFWKNTEIINYFTNFQFLLNLTI